MKSKEVIITKSEEGGDGEEGDSERVIRQGRGLPGCTLLIVCVCACMCIYVAIYVYIHIYIYVYLGM